MEWPEGGMPQVPRVETGEFRSRAPDEPRRRRVRETLEQAFAPPMPARRKPGAGETAAEDTPERIRRPALALPARRGTARQRERFWRDPFTKRILERSAICLALLALVGTVKLVDTPLTQEIAAGVYSALTFEVSVDETLGKLKFVENEAAKLAQVFAPSQSFTLARPVKGDIVEDFEALGHPYVALSAADGEFVYVCMAGTVTGTGTDAELGKYATVEHSGDKATTYYGLDEVSVATGAALQVGDTVGTMAGEDARLGLKLRVSGNAVDPEPYLK
jgi:murein DD-endopeptidase MepM/ murein hydrolase activator NlpD